MNWIVVGLYWYLMLFVLGLIFTPLAKNIFGKFFDFGYPFAKTLAILFLSYVVFVFGTIKLLPFQPSSLFLVVVIFLIINLYLFIKKKSAPASSLSIFLLIFEEILFLFSLFFWAYVRGQEPSIRGLEKFMDFGFMNSILRSKFFPPLDMWLSADSTHPAGYPINYYYFGHLAGSLLIKLSGVKPAIGYNLILATIFALGVTQAFSFVFNLIYLYQKKTNAFKIDLFSVIKLGFFGVVGSFIVNLAGNLHTIYVFTSGYPNEQPIPFWKILGSYSPGKYWYPNATRFIPFTIHEFPSYSWVVADLHGHVFDIPFVILTLAVLLIVFTTFKKRADIKIGETQNSKLKTQNKFSNFKLQNLKQFFSSNFNQFQLISTIFLGFLAAVHYMTNAFDGPIYLLLTMISFFIIFGLSNQFIILTIVLLVSFLIYSLPFSFHFSPFISGIGVNCSLGFLTKIGKIGPFLFERDKCQVSPPWMLFVLWGFFWISFILFLLLKKLLKNTNETMKRLNIFIFMLFSFGSFLIIIPEFFYIKDIYPAHFRANTMFKLGYQAFIMMSLVSAFTFFLIKHLEGNKKFVFNLIFIFFFFFIAIYPIFSIPSYYGKLQQIPNLDGQTWLVTFDQSDKEIIDFLNKNIRGQPVILEAQGDSYTDYERVSANTGLPTVAGWWVHEWLWRGSADVVGKRIPDIVNLYESADINLTRQMIEKYRIRYVIVSQMERQKYPKIQENKFSEIGRLIFQSKDKNGSIYQVD